MVDTILKRISVKNLANYLAVFVVFAGALMYDIGPFYMVRGFLLIMLLVLIIWLPFLKGLYFNRYFLILFTAIFLFSLLNVIVGYNTVNLLIRQIMGIIFSAFIFYLLIKINGYDLKRLFKVYLNIAFVIAIIGIIQGISFLIGFERGYDYSRFLTNWRLNPIFLAGTIRISSILVEPSQFCNVMIPAVFVSIMSFFKREYKFIGKARAIIIVLPFLFTFSSMGLLGILFIVALLAYQYGSKKGAILALAVFLALSSLFYFSIDSFKEKIVDSIKVVKGEIRPEIINLSTFALYSNARVAVLSFKDSPFFGAGLGSHEENYYRYINKIVDVEKIMGFVNAKDSGSLFLRLLSETGLLGLIIVFGFIFKFNLRKKYDRTGYLWIINSAVLTVFFMRLVRNGHYFNEGFFFFIWMYYFSKKKSDVQTVEIKNEDSR